MREEFTRSGEKDREKVGSRGIEEEEEETVNFFIEKEKKVKF